MGRITRGEWLGEAFGRLRSIVTPAADATVVAFLGPYRNLTTLTAATLGLHPNIVVMNHGFARVEATASLRAFDDPAPEKTQRLRQTLVELSEGGRRGPPGGSIRLSHAVTDHPAMAAAYAAAPMKEKTGAVVWKESGDLGNYLERRGLDPAEVAARWPKLRFIGPVRRPLDHIRGLRGFDRHQIPNASSPPTFEEAARHILAAHYSFWQRARRRPDGFFQFRETEMSAALLTRLASHIGVAPRADWLALAAPLFQGSKMYDHDDSERAAFRALLDETYGQEPEFVAFIESAA